MAIVLAVYKLSSGDVVVITYTADPFDLLPADVLDGAAEVAQRFPGVTEGLCGQDEGSGGPIGAQRDAEQRGRLSPRYKQRVENYAAAPTGTSLLKASLTHPSTLDITLSI